MAGNVIDTMVLVLGLDASKFTQQQKEAMDLLRRFQEEGESRGKQVESQTKRLNETLLSFKREFVTTLALVTGGVGMQQFVTNIANVDAAVGRLSYRLQVGAPNLSAWQGLMKQIGGAAEDADSAFVGLSQEINRFNLTGQSSILGVLTQLRIPGGLYDRSGKPKTPDILLRELSGAVQGMPPAQATALLSMIPGMNSTMINALLEGPQSLDRRLARARELGGTTPDSAAIAQRYQESVANFDRSVTNFGRFVGVFALPAFTKFVDWLTNLFSATPDQGKTSTDKMREKFGAPPAWAERAGTSFLNGDWLNLDLMNNAGAALNPMTIPGWWLGREMRKGGGTSPSGSSSGGGSNWSRFLSALSYLETDRRDVRSTASSATGFFQFTTATASDARRAGISDPRFGSYEDQAAATQRFIKTFHPAAAAAIERGDFAAAEAMLKGRWPSLPGGSQQQQASRYSTYRDTLAGAPAPGAGSAASTELAGSETTKNVNTTIGKVEVNAPQAKDADDIAREIAPALQRSLKAGAANYGGM